MAGRIFERKKRQMPCTLTLNGQNHGGLILDVSPGGFYIQSSAKMQPGDQLDIQMTIPGIEGRHRVQVEVVRKVVVPARLLKVARGGVGVRILNAPEAYYRFMEELGITADLGSSKIEQIENRRAQVTASCAAQTAAEPEREARAAAEPEAEPPAPQPRFRVRIKQSQGPRSRTIRVEADSREDACSRALRDAGEGWVALDAEPVDAA